MITKKQALNLFKSQEINPWDYIETILKFFKLPLKFYNNEYETNNLWTFFNHEKYSVMSLFIDFSKGKEKNKILIGKGILYDSGGYNLKKDASEMHRDKYGALTALLLGQKLKLPVKVFFGVNLIHANAILPGTIIKSKTKQVAIIDTDCEGRIGLAALIEDTLNYKNIISFATLTGHSVYSIGEGHVEMFTQNTKLSKQFITQCFKILSLGRYFKDYEKCLYKNNILQNFNSGFREAGAAKAYAFLLQFLQKNQTLTHFDIAGLMNKQYKDPFYGFTELVNSVKLIK